jgi:hypothetical protein
MELTGIHRERIDRSLEKRARVGRFLYWTAAAAVVVVGVSVASWWMSTMPSVSAPEPRVSSYRTPPPPSVPPVAIAPKSSPVQGSLSLEGETPGAVARSIVEEEPGNARRRRIVCRAWVTSPAVDSEAVYRPEDADYLTFREFSLVPHGGIRSHRRQPFIDAGQNPLDVLDRRRYRRLRTCAASSPIRGSSERRRPHREMVNY